jgi:EmrB/QacA subfamily drug resistance transporter
MQQDSSRKALLWIVAAGFFMQTLDTTIVNTALPSMAVSLHENALAMRPVVVAYSLTMAMITPASGWLADRFGTRRVYFTAILLFVLGSLLCAGSNSLHELVMARVLQGVGGSMLLPIGRLAVLRSVPSEQYISALAFISVAGQIGPVFGPVMGGLFVQTITWHWIFLINVPIGVVGLLAVRRYLPVGTTFKAAPFDFIGCGLLSLCMLAFSLALDVPTQTHRALWSAGLFVLSVLSALGYVAYAKRREYPLFRLELFREANFRVGLIGNLVCRIGCSAMPFLLPLLMQLQLGYTPLHAGLMMLPTALGGTLSKSWVAPLIKRVGYGQFLLVNTVAVGALIVSFALMSPSWPLAVSIAQLALFGATNSMQFAAMNGVTLEGVPREDAGSANSLFSMVQMLAIGLGVTIGGSLVSVFAGHLGSTALGFRWTFVCVGTITLLSAMVFRRLDVARFRAGRPAASA